MIMYYLYIQKERKRPRFEGKHYYTDFSELRNNRGHYVRDLFKISNPPTPNQISVKHCSEWDRRILEFFKSFDTLRSGRCVMCRIKISWGGRGVALFQCQHYCCQKCALWWFKIEKWRTEGHLHSMPHKLNGRWIYTPEHLEVREGRKLGGIKETSAVGQLQAGDNPDLQPNNPFVIVCDDDTFDNEVDGYNIWDTP